MPLGGSGYPEVMPDFYSSAILSRWSGPGTIHFWLLCFFLSSFCLSVPYSSSSWTCLPLELCISQDSTLASARTLIHAGFCREGVKAVGPGSQNHRMGHQEGSQDPVSLFIFSSYLLHPALKIPESSPNVPSFYLWDSRSKATALAQTQKSQGRTLIGSTGVTCSPLNQSLIQRKEVQ